MKLSDLFDCTPETQEVLLHGDGICTSIESDAESLTNVLSEHVQSMKVTDIEADGGVLKVWIEEVDNGK